MGWVPREQYCRQRTVALETHRYLRSASWGVPASPKSYRKLERSSRPSQDRSRNTPITSSFAREFRGVPEGLKELGIWPARPILGVPLHGEYKALSRQLQGLYYVVRCSCDDHKPARHMVHALMVA